MKIKILGPGCPRCHQLEKTTREVVKELGLEATVEEVKDIKKIMDYPILTTPGLVLVLVVGGFLLLTLTLHLVRIMGRLHARYARAMLSA